MPSLYDLFYQLQHRDIGPKIYDREKKRIVKERMPFYKWIENKILFTAPLDKIDQSKRVRRWLHQETIHSGHEYNKYRSANKIRPFIDMYDIKMNDFERENPSDYLTFCDFFTRKVKPDARPIAGIGDDTVIISGADCRISVFENLTEAKDLLIKGKKFTLPRLVDHHQNVVNEFRFGSVVNFRLTPMEYHRFHAPISGTLVESYYIAGEINTTKTDALRSEIDIIDENERHILVIENDNGQRCLFCPISAEEVGKINIDWQVGNVVSKGDELGFFDFGENVSDIFVMFNFDIQFDQDLVTYTKLGIETLLKFGEQIGVAM